jgi:hypothetical protein
MKRKIDNPNPQEKHMKKVEEKLYDSDMKEQIIRSEEIIETDQSKKNKNNKIIK